MTRAPVSCASILALAGVLLGACGPEEADSFEASPCQVGGLLLNEIASELSANAPACQSDADCVSIALRVECAGSKVDSCGAVVHRGVVEHYDQAQANARFCASFRPGKYGCSVQPLCTAIVTACEAGRCVGKSASQ